MAQGALDSFRNNKELQDDLLSAGVHIYIPKANEWNPAQPQTQQLKEVSIEDLLPRDEIKIDLESVADTLRGKCVLVTGSAGSIGSEIVKQICKFGPREMVSSTAPRRRSTTFAS